jgi:hypothetical protein
MNVPTIGGAKGIFEIFVPGIFLLLNLGAVMYWLPFTDDRTRRLLVGAATNPTVAIVVSVCFGYLIGVLLRLLRTDLPDRLAGAWVRRFERHVRTEDGKFHLWAIEKFPYIGWMEEVCKQYLSPEATTFYNKTWANRKRSEQNKQFFNFVKVIVGSNDERSANEMYAAESLTRYMTGMFYALSMAFFLILGTVIIAYVFSGQVLVGLIIVLCAYLFAIVEIVARFRFMRIKEVEIVFAASFKNKAIFEEPPAKSETGIWQLFLIKLRQLLSAEPQAGNKKDSGSIK